MIQIIAPAGSGKTAVLVERVRELRRRGVPPQAISCVTFNKHAKNELQSRLRKWRVGDVRARTFHGLGAMILDREGKLREHIDEPTPSQWRLLANNAKRSAGQYGVWLDPHEAQAHISELKLGRLLSPAEYADTICETSDAVERTVSALYEGYEEQRRKCDRMDYDDLIFCSLRLLRDEPSVRERWQQRFECLLVDEYQDTGSAPDPVARRMALLSAVRDVQGAARNVVDGDTDGGICDARRRIVREALHVLGPDALRELRVAVLDGGRWREWLHELSFEAMQDDELERAIAADAISSAGEKALSRAMTVRAGFRFMWHLDPDEIIRTQHCSSHNVFCCPQCPDEPTVPIAPIRGASSR